MCAVSALTLIWLAATERELARAGTASSAPSVDAPRELPEADDGAPRSRRSALEASHDAPTAAPGASPQRSADSVEAVGFVRWSGVVIDELGARRGAEPFEWCVLTGVDEPREFASGSLTTSADGSFSIQFAGGGGAIVELDLADTRQRIAERTLGRWRLPAESAEGLVLLPRTAHVLVSGSVVDRSGAPRAGVTVRATYSDGQPRLASLRRAFLMGRVTNQRGEFEIFGHDDGALLDLALRVDGESSTVRRQLRTPALGLRLVDERDPARGLRAGLKLDEGPGAQHVGLRALDAEGRETVFSRRADFEGGWLVARPLEPGLYTVEAFDPRTGAVFARIESVATPSVGLGTDPRLTPLDLSDRLRFIRVATVTSTGRRIGEQQVELATADGGRRALDAEVAGFLEFALGLDAPDLEAFDAFERRVKLIDGGSIVVVALE